jgi:hypothetical protein
MENCWGQTLANQRSQWPEYMEYLRRRSCFQSFKTKSEFPYLLQIIDKLYDISSIVLSKYRVPTATYAVHNEVVMDHVQTAHVVKQPYFAACFFTHVLIQAYGHHASVFSVIPVSIVHPLRNSDCQPLFLHILNPVTISRSLIILGGDIISVSSLTVWTRAGNTTRLLGWSIPV